jgi:acetyl-CoA C-acetyltransferase
MLLEREPGVVGPNSDAHRTILPTGAVRPPASRREPVPSPAVTLDPRTPVIIGAGQAIQRVDDPLEALETADLMAAAARSAFADAGVTAPGRVDSVRVVSLFSWDYGDPGAVLAARLGLAAAETVLTAPGGQSPQYLVNLTAAEIAAGRLDLALLAGGETWRTVRRARKAGVELLWDTSHRGRSPSRLVGSTRSFVADEEQAVDLVRPVQVYPIIETVLRAARGETPEAHLRRIAQLWARFAAVAATNPFAWVRTAPTAEQIGTPGPSNRLIGLPYPKLMNSNNDVDLAAAVVICSAERAEALGVARDRWVFPLAGVSCDDIVTVSHRDRLGESTAVAVAGRRLLGLAGASIDDVELVDLYSCFPSAVQIGADALGLDHERQLTRTGGLTFAGGPWNNYSMHGIAALVADLRAAAPDALGLLWANGGYVSKHALGLYGTRPGRPFVHDHTEAQAEVDRTAPRCEVAPVDRTSGAAVVEGYTVMHTRDGVPEAGWAACRLPDGRRAWARTTDPVVAGAMTDGEWVGRSVTVADGGVLLV